MSSRKLLQHTIGLTLVVLLLGGCGGVQAEPTATTRAPADKDTAVAPQLSYDSGCARPIVYVCSIRREMEEQICTVCPDVSRLTNNYDRLDSHSDSSEITQLTTAHEGNHHNWPVWSPDGQWIAFTRGRSDSDDNVANVANEIFIIRADGTEETQLTFNNFDMLPSWSPDGQWVLFIRWRLDPNDFAREIFIVRPDGSELTQLTFNNNDSRPYWSPDGRWIVFTREALPGAGEYASDVFKIRADGTEETQLTFNDAYWSGSWSPDGQWVAVVRVSRLKGEIFIMRPDGSELTQLTSSHYSDGSLSWSPDGQWVAFVRGEFVDSAIFVMRADGSMQTQLTDRSPPNAVPDW